MLASILKKLGAVWSIAWPASRGSAHPSGAALPLQNGRRPDDGPPDLDQLWRDFNARLQRLIGGNDSGGNGNNNANNFQPDMKGAGIGAGVVVIVLTFLWLLSGAFTVSEGQVGVVMTLGKYSHNASPGLNWRFPYPIQQHEIVNVSTVRTVKVGYREPGKTRDAVALREALMLTDDENIIDIQMAVQYTLKSPTDWLFKNRDLDDNQHDNPRLDPMRQIAETAIREVVGKHKMDFVLYEGREKVALDVNKLMQEILDRYESGVQVTNVTMQNVQPPSQVQDAFDDAVKAGQDREKKKNEGLAYENDIVPKARGDASALVTDAEAYRSRVVETATGDASRFRQVVGEYQKAPAVTRDRLYLETMQQMFANVTKVMVDTKGGNNLISLPLDKMMAQSAAIESSRATAVQAAQAASASAVSEQPVAEGLRRESRKSDNRDRESR